MKKTPFIALGLSYMASIAATHAATTLTAGDIAFLSLNFDGDDRFSFVLLDNVGNGTAIHFTDRGWNDGAGGGFFTTLGDGSFTWTTTSDLSAGTVITISAKPTSPTASTGIISGFSGLLLSSAGDQLFAYQGDGNSSDLIAGIHSNSGSDISNWNGSATNNQASALPDVFTNGNQAVVLGAVVEVDNWRYNASSSSSLSGTPEEIRAVLHNASNWSSSNSSELDTTPSNFGTFNVTIVPEPSTLTCLSLPFIVGLFRRRRGE